MKARKCLICQNPLPEVIKENTHPACVLFDDTPAQDPLAMRLKSQLTDIIKWADRNSARTLQKTIGPSEIGDQCDRRIGYRIAEVPEVNDRFDPWAAIVGTSIHSWLDQAIRMYTLSTGNRSWISETAVQVAGGVRGTSDLFNLEEACVVDHKGAGSTVMKEVVRNGPSAGYIVQTQLYGLGYERMGYEVRKIALVFYPRAGRLRDIYVWTADYDRSVAEKALARVSAIASEVISLDVLKEGHEHRWEQVNSYPSNYCGFCPWYVPDRDPDIGANGKGCPGR